MKMLTRVAGASSARSSTTASTRPSAGETTTRSSPGATRSGSRKKKRQNPTATTSGISVAGCPARVPTTATSPKTPAAMATTGQPSRAIRKLVTRAIDEAIRGEPRHEAAKPRADLLDRVRAGLLPQLAEVREAAAVLGDPLVGELAGLDVREEGFHRLARLLADDALAAGHVAVLGRVADRVAHVRDAALVDEIDDELHLVQTLEVRHLGRVARLDERLVAGADELGEPAAEDGLLAEEIGLRLFLERGLEHAGARAADALRVREPDLLRITARILLDGEQARNAAALLVLAAHEMPGALRRDHEHVHVGGRNDLLEVDVEPVAEREVLAGLEARRDVALVDLAALLVGHEDHDDVGLARGGGGVDDAEPGLLRLR